MKIQELLKSCLEDLKRITRADFCLLDSNGDEIANTFDKLNLQKSDITAFLKSAADSQNLQGHLFMKIRDGKEYVLIEHGSDGDGYALGQIACSEISHILKASMEEMDEKHFYQDLFEGNMEQKEIMEKATVLEIPENLLRVVYLVEIEKELLESGKELLSNLFDEQGQDFADYMDGQLVLVKALKNKKEETKLLEYARQIESMLNTEIMASVRVSYGNVAHNLEECAKSYHEAKVALEVAKIFYDGRTVAAYSALGIGRLIHELPTSLCEMFLDEVFGGKKLNFTEEELTTIDKFFENNLNISETARELFIHRNTLVYHLEKLQKATGLDIRRFDDALTFKIATMVDRYLKQKKLENKKK